MRKMIRLSVIRLADVIDIVELLDTYGPIGLTYRVIAGETAKSIDIVVSGEERVLELAALELGETNKVLGVPTYE